MDWPRTATGPDMKLGFELAPLLASQAASGAFPSVAHTPSGPHADENAFVTTLMVLHLCELRRAPGIEAAIARALDFLLSCQHPRRPGAFCFYPPRSPPAWLGAVLPPDVDDTALAALALYRARLWQGADLHRVLVDVLERHRIRTAPPGAPWFRAGVFPTWLDAGRLRNPIDICVNLNIATLIEVAGIETPLGHAGILEMALAALDWVGAAPGRACAVMPYYPHAAELRFALLRARAAEVPGTASLLGRLREQPWIHTLDASAPICGNWGAGTVWTCAGLQALRARAPITTLARFP